MFNTFVILLPSFFFFFCIVAKPLLRWVVCKESLHTTTFSNLLSLNKLMMTIFSDKGMNCYMNINMSLANLKPQTFPHHKSVSSAFYHIFLFFSNSMISSLSFNLCSRCDMVSFAISNSILYSLMLVSPLIGLLSLVVV